MQQRRWYVKKVSVHEIPSDISTVSLKRTLKAHSISFEDGPTCLATLCTICAKLNKNPDDSRIYINKTTGAFICACNYAGQWNELKQSFNAKNTKCKTARDSAMLEDMDRLKSYIKETNKATVTVNTLSMAEQTEILGKFELKGCTPLPFEVLDVRVNSLRDTLYFPLRNTQTKSTVGFTLLVAPSGAPLPTTVGAQQPQLSYLPVGGVVFGRVGARSSHGIVVPTVRDMLVLLSAARSVSATVVVAPGGLATLSQFVLPCFESFTKVTLWLGEDLHGLDAARIFARKLGEKRCLAVRSSSSGQEERTNLPQVDPAQNFRAVLQAAQPLWHKSITNFASLRDEVLSDLLNIDKVQGVKWTRFPALTRLLKGHRRGELTVLTGPTGSGKTTFISEYSLDLAMQGMNTLWGSFEIRNARLARTMLQQHAGIQLDEHLGRFAEFADAFEQLPIYFMTFHGQQPVRVVMDAIEHAVYVHDIAHVIIDNVQFMLGLSGGDTMSAATTNSSSNDRFYRQDQVVAAFRTFATQRNCHVTLVIHPRKERDDERLTTASIFGGAKASQEADNVLILQDGRLSSLRGKKYLQVAKNRYSGDLGIMPLDFNKITLSFAQKKEKEKTQVNNERVTTSSNELRKKKPTILPSDYFANDQDDNDNGKL